jgi:hypothetical protein
MLKAPAVAMLWRGKEGGLIVECGIRIAEWEDGGQRVEGQRPEGNGNIQHSTSNTEH